MAYFISNSRHRKFFCIPENGLCKVKTELYIKDLSFMMTMAKFSKRMDDTKGARIMKAAIKNKFALIPEVMSFTLTE